MGKSYSVDVPRLCAAVQRSRAALRYPRIRRLEMVRAMAGPYYSEECKGVRRFMNLLGLYVQIMSRDLVPQSPRALLSTFDPQQKASVAALQEWLNVRIERNRADNILRRCATDALFGYGIIQVALATPADAAHLAWGLKAGEPYMAVVDPDDWVYDAHARDFDEVQFMGNRIRVPLDAIKDDKMFGKGRKDLQESSDPAFNQEGDMRINLLGRTFTSGQDEEYEPMVDLWNIYLPRHRCWVILADDYLGGGASGDSWTGDALLEQDFVGPERGPQHVLGYGTVPGNAQPKGPVQDLFDMDTSINRIYDKLVQQAERQKEVIFVSGAADADGNRLVDTPDGTAIRVDRPNEVQQRMWGGPNPQNFALFSDSINRYSYIAGNLDITGGLSPQAKTLGQERLLAGNSSRSVADMQARTTEFTARVYEAECWYWWYHPTKVVTSVYTPRGLPELARAQPVYPSPRKGQPTGPLTRRGPMPRLIVDPYSMQSQGPSDRVETILKIVTQVYAPLAALAQQQGVSIDMNFLFKRLGELIDVPDLAELLTLREPPQGQSGGSQEPGMPQQTTRTQIRENRSSQNRESSDRNTTAAMMGVNVGGSRNGKPQPMGV